MKIKHYPMRSELTVAQIVIRMVKTKKKNHKGLNYCKINPLVKSRKDGTPDNLPNNLSWVITQDHVMVLWNVRLVM